LEYDDEKKVLRIIPTLDNDKTTTVAISARGGKAGDSRMRVISITSFLNFVSLDIERGYYLAKGTPDGVEVYLDNKLDEIPPLVTVFL